MKAKEKYNVLVGPTPSGCLRENVRINRDSILKI